MLLCLTAGLGCQGRQDSPSATANGAANGTTPTAADARAVEGRRPAKAHPAHECMACVMEDQHDKAHKDQIAVSARYLGIKERWLDGHRTNRRCTKDYDVIGVVRFVLLGDDPWRDQVPPPAGKDSARTIEVDLPCPELSRPAYARLDHYDPDDTQRDGLGHAPILRRGHVYRLTIVRNPILSLNTTHPTGSRPVLTLVAVNLP